MTHMPQARALDRLTLDDVVAVARDRGWVATSHGRVALTELQFEGKRRMTAREFMAGHPLRTGMMLGQELGL